MTEAATFIPPLFKESGLPQDPMVQKAYEQVKHIARAVGSAQVLAEMIPSPGLVAGHLLSFVNAPRIPLEQIDTEYSGEVANTVKSIRKIYDEKLPIARSGTSFGVHASFIACVIWDTDKHLSDYKNTPLTAAFMSVSQKEDRTVIRQFSFEQQLRELRRELEDTFLPLAEASGFPPIINRFKKSLNALELKIALPDSPPGKPSAAPRNEP
ncbi:MAG: hypothetical protein ACXW4B_11460 [Micavibrio sp.]